MPRHSAQQPTAGQGPADLTARPPHQTADLFPCSEGHYRLLFDKNPLPAWVFDLDSLAFLAANDTAVRHYGYSRQELLGLTVKDIHPSETIPELLAHLATAPAEGEDRSGDWRHRTRDGAILSVELAWQDVAFAGQRARLLLAQDVTGRKQAEGELHESDRRLRQLAENVRAVFWMTDARATRLLYVSPTYEEVWGRPCEGLYERPETWQQAIHPDDREGAASTFERFVRDGRAYEQEYRVVRPDGSARWVRDRGFPVRDVAGQVYRVAGIAEDVTRQKQKDEELRRHARQQEVLAVLGRSALADEGPQARLDGAARLIAQALKVEIVAIWELLSDDALRVCAGVRWNAGEAGAEAQASYTLRVNEPVVVDDLETEERFDGASVRRALGAVSGLSVPVGGRGRPFGVLAIHSARRREFLPEEVHFLQAVANVLAEAVARKEAEEALRGSKQFTQAVLDSLAAHVAVLDQHGTILTVNEGWKKFARDNGCADLVGCGAGANYLEACRNAGEEGAVAVLHGLGAVLRGERSLFTHEYPCHSPAQRRWFLMRATPCTSRRGCAVVAHVDITERKVAEEALREADRRKDEFLAVLAHELRNPLAPIRNAVQVLKEPRASGAVLAGAREILERQVGHLSRLVDDLVDVSRLTRGRVELHKEMVEVAGLLARAVEAVRPLLDERRHELTVAASPVGLRVEADPTRLEQVLFNLLHNAAKYSDPGGHVWLTAGREGAEVVLRVRDVGAGIAPAMLPFIFDPLVQAERRLKRSQGGVGIGLALVRKLAELHGGTAEATSAGPGQGSEFVVRLPAPAEGPIDQGVSGPHEEGTLPTVPPRRVLVVDDNCDAADSLGLLLKLAGQDVRVAYDGASALALARDFRPALAFLDVGMPGMDGHELARRLRQEPALAGAVLVALTGWGQEEDRRRTREAGFDHHLVKPASPNALQRLLAELRPPAR